MNKFFFIIKQLIKFSNKRMKLLTLMHVLLISITMLGVTYQLD